MSLIFQLPTDPGKKELFWASIIAFIFLIFLWRLLRQKSQPKLPQQETKIPAKKQPPPASTGSGFVRHARGNKLPYRRRDVLTRSELVLYRQLQQALPHYWVLPQVGVSRVITADGAPRSYYWFNFISRMSYDFVICRADGFPLAAIELDDPSHARPERQDADYRKNCATEAAGIMMIRWETGKVPDRRTIAALIAKADKQAGKSG